MICSGWCEVEQSWPGRPGNSSCCHSEWSPWYELQSSFCISLNRDDYLWSLNAFFFISISLILIVFSVNSPRGPWWTASGNQISRPAAAWLGGGLILNAMSNNDEIILWWPFVYIKWRINLNWRGQVCKREEVALGIFCSWRRSFESGPHPFIPRTLVLHRVKFSKTLICWVRLYILAHYSVKSSCWS